MIKVMFVCHGNICRSPMAEFVFRDLVEKEGLCDRIVSLSSATSGDAIGWPVHEGTAARLAEAGISCRGKTSVRFTRKDYTSCDFIACMDTDNVRNAKKIAGGDNEGKIKRLLDYSSRPADIADPWYTRDFDACWKDVSKGCEALLDHIKKDLS